MEDNVRALLAEYEARAKQEFQKMASLPAHEVGARIDEFLIFVGPETGQLLHILARAAKARCIVEVGASYGYSTIWLAHAAKQTGGKVESFELSASKVEFARAKLQSVGLDRYVQFHVGDVLTNLPQLTAPLDFVLIDCWKNIYEPCFELVYPRLTAEGIIVADNMLYPEDTRPHALAYQQRVRSKPDLDTLLLPVGSGIELTRRRPPALGSTS
jgi:predicted O-methyltransferase YrrM